MTDQEYTIISQALADSTQEPGFWSNVANWLQGGVNSVGDELRANDSVLASSRDAFFAGDTPLYTMERDNSVANAFNNWLNGEKARAAAADQASRNAYINANQQFTQAGMTSDQNSVNLLAQLLMNKQNMEKYAAAEAEKVAAEQKKLINQNLGYTIDAYKSMTDEISKLTGKNNRTANEKARLAELQKGLPAVEQKIKDAGLEELILAGQNKVNAATAGGKAGANAESTAFKTTQNAVVNWFTDQIKKGKSIDVLKQMKNITIDGKKIPVSNYIYFDGGALKRK